MALLHGGRAGEISASAEAAIRSGGLGPGEPLPPVRRLAEHLGVSPTTVAAAYRDLQVRGLVTASGRRGTRVSPRPPVTRQSAAAVPAARSSDRALVFSSLVATTDRRRGPQCVGSRGVREPRQGPRRL